MARETFRLFLVPLCVLMLLPFLPNMAGVLYSQVLITDNWLPSDAPPVHFELYYEALCPDCQEFFLSQLYPNAKNLGSIMNITLIPYGNAKVWHTPENQQRIMVLSNKSK